MTNTLERTITTVNDAVTDRLDSLEEQLPAIPSKALAAARSSARAVNSVVENTACSIRSRVTTVGDDASAAVATSTGQARAAAEKTSATISGGVKQTTGQARAAAEKTTSTVKQGVAQTTGQARAAAEKTTAAVKQGVAETTGQARTNAERVVGSVKKGVAETTGQIEAQAERVADSAAHEVEGALDDAKVATEPDDLAKMSKADLYELAQDRDIDGRSGMTKAELIGALQKS
ncbi:Rho termination factor N-terminal domain-containing protein [Ilumatobacter sp.]|uniref:Rho termination factor N-terminal domain-containing protein n=1 Tax=Ilumatobacter sp. TaxID=1967498 RepID=UPI003C577FBB